MNTIELLVNHRDYLHLHLPRHPEHADWALEVLRDLMQGQTPQPPLPTTTGTQPR
jgi:hypothetical protein